MAGYNYDRARKERILFENRGKNGYYMEKKLLNGAKERGALEDRKPVQRKKNIVGEGKGVQINKTGKVNGKAADGIEAEQMKKRAEFSKYLNNVRKARDKIPKETQAKQTEKMKRRKDSEARDMIDGIYRENYMPADSYDKWMNQLYGDKRRKR